jgi:hypothetical protein
VLVGSARGGSGRADDCRVQSISPVDQGLRTERVFLSEHRSHTTIFLANDYGVDVSSPSSAQRRTVGKDPGVVLVRVQQSLEACRVRVVLSSERAAIGVSR